MSAITRISGVSYIVSLGIAAIVSNFASVIEIFNFIVGIADGPASKASGLLQIMTVVVIGVFILLADHALRLCFVGAGVNLPKRGDESVADDSGSGEGGRAGEYTIRWLRLLVVLQKIQAVSCGAAVGFTIAYLGRFMLVTTCSLWDFILSTVILMAVYALAERTLYAELESDKDVANSDYAKNFTLMFSIFGVLIYFWTFLSLVKESPDLLLTGEGNFARVLWGVWGLAAVFMVDPKSALRRD